VLGLWMEVGVEGLRVGGQSPAQRAECRVWRVGCRVIFRDWGVGFGCRVWGVRCREWVVGCRVQGVGVGCRVQGVGCGVWGVGYRVWGVGWRPADW
jgi:hypothetical protein